jgi:hypothetical protein
MKLKLHHVPNPDIPGGYYEPPIDPQEMTITVDVISDASREYRLRIALNGVGSSNLAEDSGLLYIGENAEPYAYVSYNSNVWSMAGNKLYEADWQMSRIDCLPADWKWQ